MSKRAPGEIATQPTSWQDLLLICRKCGRKLDGGFGPDGEDTLRRALRGALRERGQRRGIGLVEVGCLGACPKGAVTLAQASRPGELLLVPRGTAPEALLDRLLPPAGG